MRAGPLFPDRAQAGRELATLLKRYEGEPDLLVLALPRGGVVVGYEVAQALHAPLDVFVVRKLGVPGYEELAMGAVAPGDVITLNEEVVAQVGATQEVIDMVADRELRELERREREYRGDRAPPHIQGRIIILVDDGLATGATMRAAAVAVRRQSPRRLVVAVPVAARETCDRLRNEVDELICAQTPEPFFGVGAWYADFPQLTDEEVRALLTGAADRHTAGHAA